MTDAAIFDPRPCLLGEGPLWHPGRGQLFWFSITERLMLTRPGAETVLREFPEMVSAAGWIDDETLLVASETGLWRTPLAGGWEKLADIEADNPATRSNDGRADPQGGFWIGTMGKAGETGAGAFYRYYRGEVRTLFTDITTTNAISFTPDGGQAYWADTRTRRVMRSRLDRDGWPVGEPELFLDLKAENLRPDGAVVDAAGNFWNAQYGAGRVACYSPAGALIDSVAIPGAQSTCPAFGGADLTTLYCTSAWQGLPDDRLQGDHPEGRTYVATGLGPGQAEHRVIL